ncbi:MAG TPA: HlyD family secretion protein [Methyloceanibacter sp.]|nr:HlyD family secretion protein [Methyloceanibacter sp.]
MNQDASTEVRASTNTVATIRWVALAAVIVATVAGAFAYWRHSALYPTTENAYTGSNIVRVASEVSGPVVHVYVRTDETVKQNDPLFDIDPTLYDAALRNARAQFDAAASAAGTAGDSLKAAAATLEQKRVALEDAIKTYRDAKDAQAPGQPPSDQLNSAESAWQDALKAYKDAETAFATEQDKPLTITTPTTQLRAAAAQLSKATHDRVKTHATAPADGLLSNVTLRPGANVQAGAPLFAIIEANRWWVDANFKETDLARVKVGQPATVRLDMYPDVTFDGTVESISAASGATFSVLPPENASGNWVKVTQRFPVRISLTNPPPDKPLRVGASTTVTIDTTKDQNTSQDKK